MSKQRAWSLILTSGAIALSAGTARAQCPSWRNFAPEGPNGAVHASVVFDDGNGPALYVGGSFTGVTDVVANHVAGWDGSVWRTLGSGTDGTVFALCVFDDGTGPALYAAGEFSTAGGVAASRIAKWDGSAWSPLGEGLRRSWIGPNPYHAGVSLAVFDDGTGPALYVGGYFLAAGTVPARNVARWDGSTWSAVGAGVAHGAGFALAVHDDGSGPALFASGGGGHYLGRWDGSTWSPLGSGPDSTVMALAVHDDGSGPALFAGGYFNNAGGVPAREVAKWNGSTWSALGGGMTSGGQVSALTSFDDGSGSALYAGGAFWSVEGIPAARLARWDGSAWSTLADGVDGEVRTFAVFDGGLGPRLYAAGLFSSSGSKPMAGICAWTGTDWSGLGPALGMNLFIYALVAHDDGTGPALFAGGRFTLAGSAAANYIARGDGLNWSPLSTGMDDSVFALAVFDDGAGPALYAGGRFSVAGGTSALRLAKWDGAAWSAVGGGTNAAVLSLAVFDDGSGPALYAGGQFSAAGGQPAAGVARWDGAAWTPLGSGVTGHIGAFTIVRCIATFDDGSGPALYVGGDFTSAGGASANQIARWDGSAWTPLGSGLGGTSFYWARALCEFDGGTGPALYVGGDFTTAGGAPANRVARWNGSAWSALGAGVDATVFALAVYDDGSGPGLFAAGGFSSAGGMGANQIARWDGSQWSSLGAGLDLASVPRPVRALAVFDDPTSGDPGLWVGGEFLEAGGFPSLYLAEWRGCGVTQPGFCFGDGSGSACPCGNLGGATGGCANSVASGGALLTATGTASVAADSLVLSANGMTDSFALFLQGTAALNGGAGVPFGDGLRCVGGGLVRLATKTSVAGASTFPESGDPLLSVRGEISALGAVRTYQVWYRDLAGPCGSGFNLTNGVSIVWAP